MKWLVLALCAAAVAGEDYVGMFEYSGTECNRACLGLGEGGGDCHFDRFTGYVTGHCYSQEEGWIKVSTDNGGIVATMYSDASCTTAVETHDLPLSGCLHEQEGAKKFLLLEDWCSNTESAEFSLAASVVAVHEPGAQCATTHWWETTPLMERCHLVGGTETGGLVYAEATCTSATTASLALFSDPDCATAMVGYTFTDDQCVTLVFGEDASVDCSAGMFCKDVALSNADFTTGERHTPLFDVVSTAATFTNALQDCQSRGGSLAAVTSVELSAYAAAVVTTDSWIGLQSGAWANGDVSAFTNFAAGADTTQACTLSGTSGEWSSAACGETHPYICQFEPPKMVRMDAEPMNFFEARRACYDATGGDLAALRDAATNAWVSHWLNAGGQAWFGLSNRGPGHLWLDGEAVATAMWASSEPSEGCANLGADGLWHTANCDDQAMAAICDADAETFPVGTDYEFILISDEQLSFDAARTRCENFQSSLAMPESEAVYLAALTFLQAHQVSGGVWIGVTVGSDGTLTGVNGDVISSADVASLWGVGQPDGNGGCVSLDTSTTGFPWSQDDCSTPHHALCYAPEQIDVNPNSQVEHVVAMLRWEGSGCGDEVCGTLDTAGTCAPQTPLVYVTNRCFLTVLDGSTQGSGKFTWDGQQQSVTLTYFSDADCTTQVFVQTFNAGECVNPSSDCADCQRQQVLVLENWCADEQTSEFPYPAVMFSQYLGGTCGQGVLREHMFPIAHCSFMGLDDQNGNAPRFGAAECDGESAFRFTSGTDTCPATTGMSFDTGCVAQFGPTSIECNTGWFCKDMGLTGIDWSTLQGPHVSNGNDVGLLFVNENDSFQDAADQCTQFGLSLAVIDSTSLLADAVSVLQHESFTGTVWLGLSVTDSGEIDAVNGNSFDTAFINWDDGQPTPGCVVYDAGADVWRTDNCENTRPYLCLYSDDQSNPDPTPMPDGDVQHAIGVFRWEGTGCDENSCGAVMDDSSTCLATTFQVYVTGECYRMPNQGQQGSVMMAWNGATVQMHFYSDATCDSEMYSFPVSPGDCIDADDQCAGCSRLRAVVLQDFCSKSQTTEFANRLPLAGGSDAGCGSGGVVREFAFPTTDCFMVGLNDQGRSSWAGVECSSDTAGSWSASTDQCSSEANSGDFTPGCVSLFGGLSLDCDSGWFCKDMSSTGVDWTLGTGPAVSGGPSTTHLIGNFMWEAPDQDTAACMENVCGTAGNANCQPDATLVFIPGHCYALAGSSRSFGVQYSSSGSATIVQNYFTSTDCSGSAQQQFITPGTCFGDEQGRQRFVLLEDWCKDGADDEYNARLGFFNYYLSGGCDGLAYGFSRPPGACFFNGHDDDGSQQFSAAWCESPTSLRLGFWDQCWADPTFSVSLETGSCPSLFGGMLSADCSGNWFCKSTDDVGIDWSTGSGASIVNRGDSGGGDGGGGDDGGDDTDPMYEGSPFAAVDYDHYSFDGAHTHCLDVFGGGLAVVADMETQMALMGSVHGDELVWIGVQRDASGALSGVNGEAISFSPVWASSDRQQSGAGCVAINGDGQWLALDCSEELYSVCTTGTASVVGPDVAVELRWRSDSNSCTEYSCTVDTEGCEKRGLDVYVVGSCFGREDDHSNTLQYIRLEGDRGHGLHVHFFVDDQCLLYAGRFYASAGECDAEDGSSASRVVLLRDWCASEQGGDFQHALPVISSFMGNTCDGPHRTFSVPPGVCFLNDNDDESGESFGMAACQTGGAGSFQAFSANTCEGTPQMGITWSGTECLDVGEPVQVDCDSGLYCKDFSTANLDWASFAADIPPSPVDIVLVEMYEDGSQCAQCDNDGCTVQQGWPRFFSMWDDMNVELHVGSETYTHMHFERGDEDWMVRVVFESDTGARLEHTSNSRECTEHDALGAYRAFLVSGWCQDQQSDDFPLGAVRLEQFENADCTGHSESHLAPGQLCGTVGGTVGTAECQPTGGVQLQVFASLANCPATPMTSSVVASGDCTFGTKFECSANRAVFCKALTVETAMEASVETPAVNCRSQDAADCMACAKFFPCAGSLDPHCLTADALACQNCQQYASCSVCAFEWDSGCANARSFTGSGCTGASDFTTSGGQAAVVALNMDGTCRLNPVWRDWMWADCSAAQGGECDVNGNVVNTMQFDLSGATDLGGGVAEVCLDTSGDDDQEFTMLDIFDCDGAHPNPCPDGQACGPAPCDPARDDDCAVLTVQSANGCGAGGMTGTTSVGYAVHARASGECVQDASGRSYLRLACDNGALSGVIGCSDNACTQGCVQVSMGANACATAQWANGLQVTSALDTCGAATPTATPTPATPTATATATATPTATSAGGGTVHTPTPTPTDPCPGNLLRVSNACVTDSCLVQIPGSLCCERMVSYVDTCGSIASLQGDSCWDYTTDADYQRRCTANRITTSTTLPITSEDFTEEYENAYLNAYCDTAGVSRGDCGISDVGEVELKATGLRIEAFVLIDSHTNFNNGEVSVTQVSTQLTVSNFVTKLNEELTAANIETVNEADVQVEIVDVYIPESTSAAASLVSWVSVLVALLALAVARRV